MENEQLGDFSKKIVSFVRDAAIRDLNSRLNTTNSNLIAKRWQKSQKNDDFENYSKMLIADCVDETIFRFLNAIDQDVLNLKLLSEGKLINLSEEGEGMLGGVYIGIWRSELSKERVFDNFQDSDFDFLNFNQK